MQRSSKLGQLCRPASSLGPLQCRTVTSQSSGSLRGRGVGLSQKDKLMESLSGILEETAQARDKKEWNAMRKGGTSILDRAANWTHATPMRNRRVPPQGVPQESVKKILSAPLDTFEGDAFNTELGNQTLPKGSFLEVRRSGAVIHAVAMSPYYSERSRQIHTLTTTGEAIPFNEADIMLCIPGFVDQGLIDACGTMKLHTTEAELVARTRVLAELRAMDKQIERALRYVDNHATSFHGRMHWMNAPNPHEWTVFDLQTAAKFYRRPDNLETPLATTIAVHKNLMDNPRKFIAHPTAYRETQVFLVRPKVQTQNIADVTNWMRIEGGRILNEFCDKVKVIMERAEALRRQSTSTTPHEIPTDYNYTLTDTDREILRFLSDAFHTQRLTQFNPHSLPTIYILKRLDFLDDTEWPINQLGALQRVLTDLGVLSPWADGASFASRIDSLAHRPLVTRPTTPACSTSKPLSDEYLYTSDPLEALRHDFGDMPVYVIDDASASELDDGVSIETIPSEPDNHWVHVHVADPTTLLHPRHDLSLKAREMSESSYLVHGTSYMLPPSMFKRFSLGHTAVTKEPQQVMTFSFKVDAAGDLVDYKVRAAIIKNVHLMTYDAVDATLGLPSFAPTFPFELPNLSLPSDPPIDPGHVEQLKLLYNVSSRLITNRALRPVFNFSISTSEVRFTHPILPHLPSPYMETDVSTMDKFKLHGGFPDMSYSVPSPEGLTRGARAMVSEFMKGACRVASRFGVENGVPLIRRHGSEPTGPDPAAIERLIASRDEFGMVDPYEVNKAMVGLPKTVNTVAPKSHWALGIPEGEGYVRVTSPLRRFADLLAHWQIKHALLVKLDPDRFVKGKQFGFGEVWLSKYAREATIRDREKKRANVSRNEYWSGMFLKRWLDEEIKSETLDPKTAVFEARPGAGFIKDGVGKYRMRSMISQLGVWGDITSDGPLEIGSRMNVRITGIKAGPRPRVNLEPV